ncbi:17-beta-hydroxysteroid dehydrogenase 13-like [Harmonia axyridis]|uniref:17-beta-hydroxysteroid dehydrogenase 13-like n=1 Tax=Harmonia axyridis TaxID=115357 RepID=UPI001E2753A8|nr:17-beta-hydroxysteroid dehydrogenase 13-like [Harmonia axyridis]
MVEMTRTVDDVNNGHSTSVLNSSKKESFRVGNPFYQILEIISFLILWNLQILYYTGEWIYRLFYKSEPKSVKNDVVLITGTGHGIGKQLALYYAKAGATVVGWDINKENNDQTIQEINQMDIKKAYGYVVDVSDADNVVNTAELVQQQVGEVTILIANAGIMPCHLLMEHSREEIRRIMNINVFQLFWLMEAFLPTMMKNNKGHIVAMSSVAGLGGFPNLVPYCATKYAVRGFMESLNEELRMNRNNQIKLTTIYPYMVDTGLCKNPSIKFDALMQTLKPDHVARKIMMAQRRDVAELSLPNYLLPLQNILRIVPRKAFLKFVDFLDSRIESDLVMRNTSE